MVLVTYALAYQAQVTTTLFRAVPPIVPVPFATVQVRPAGCWNTVMPYGWPSGTWPS